MPAYWIRQDPDFIVLDLAVNRRTGGLGRAGRAEAESRHRRRTDNCSLRHHEGESVRARGHGSSVEYPLAGILPIAIGVEVDPPIEDRIGR